MRPNSIHWQTAEMVSPEFSPRQVLTWRYMRWIGSVVLLQALLSGALLWAVTAFDLHRLWQPSGCEVNDALASAILHDLVNEESELDLAALEALVSEPQVAFATVRDGQGASRYTQVADAELFEAYHAMPPDGSEGRTPAGAGASRRRVNGQLMVYEFPLSTGAEGGLLILGLRQHGAGWPVTGWLVQATAAVLVAMCSLPLIALATRRRRKAVRELMEGIRHLARGAPPKPVSVGANSEVGYLAAAFNDMASKLMASRQALVNANAQLEQTVDRRTQELRQAVDQLDKMASADPLTGLANRRALHTALEQCFGTSYDDLACVMIDLDGFKQVNDTLGHQMGDKLLHIAADVIQKHCRRNDLPARLGGDEFVVLMPINSLADARSVAQRIGESFTEAAAQLLAGVELSRMPSMSLGVASRDSSRAASGDELMMFADRALYDAKGRGKACVVVYEPERPTKDEAVAANGQPVDERP